MSLQWLTTSRHFLDSIFISGGTFSPLLAVIDTLSLLRGLGYFLAYIFVCKLIYFNIIGKLAPFPLRVESSQRVAHDVRTTFAFARVREGLLRGTILTPPACLTFSLQSVWSASWPTPSTT